MPLNFRNKTVFMASATFQGGAAIDDNFVAGEDLSAKQYYFVAPGSVLNEVLVCACVATPNPIGVLQNSPTVGQTARVRVFGRTTMAGSPNATGCNLKYGRWITAGCAGAAAVPLADTCPVFGRWLSASVPHTATTACGEAFVNTFWATCVTGLGGV